MNFLGPLKMPAGKYNVNIDIDEQEFTGEKHKLQVHCDRNSRLKDVRLSFSKFNKKHGWVTKDYFSAISRASRQGDFVIVEPRGTENRFGIEANVYYAALAFVRHNYEDSNGPWSREGDKKPEDQSARRNNAIY